MVFLYHSLVTKVLWLPVRKKEIDKSPSKILNDGIVILRSSKNYSLAERRKCSMLAEIIIDKINTFNIVLEGKNRKRVLNCKCITLFDTQNIKRMF